MTNMEQVPITVLPDGRVSRKDAARFLGYLPKTLEEWARLGRGPRGRRVGGRVFYDLTDLQAFARGDKAAA